MQVLRRLGVFPTSNLGKQWLIIKYCVSKEKPFEHVHEVGEEF